MNELNSLLLEDHLDLPNNEQRRGFGLIIQDELPTFPNLVITAHSAFSLTAS